MRINEDIRKAVVFLCSHDPDSHQFTLQGTAVIITYHADGWPQQYLVTASHVVRNCRYPIGSKGDECVYARVNRLGRTPLHPQIAYEWWTPKDHEIDIAVAPFDWRFDSETATLTPDSLALPGTDFDQYSFGIGDDLYVVGLFVDDPGEGRNRPILRSGMLAAEADPSDPHSVHLAELRSTGGLSGSPVWAMFGNARNPDGTPNDQFRAFLIGIISGHNMIEAYNLEEPVRSQWTERVRECPDRLAPGLRQYFQELNRGIATVTPIWHALPILKSEEAVAHRRKRAKEWRREIQTGGALNTGNTDQPPGD
jgi:hypothetical protein